jgi:hypothetical protein
MPSLFKFHAERFGDIENARIILADITPGRTKKKK